MNNAIVPVLIGVASLALALMAPDARSEQRHRAAANTDSSAIVESDSFRVGHPDLRWRQDAIQSYRRGDMDLAFARFERAARYADKPSQAMVAEMLWTGSGVARDRALAYAWMDLAAERQQKDFLLKREYYWSRLSASERQRALELGVTVYAEFGDDIAKPRQAREMARVKRGATGSRLGWAGFMKSVPFRETVEVAPVNSALFFADRYWDDASYWQWQDTLWDQGQKGVVEVLPLRPIEQH